MAARWVLKSHVGWAVPTSQHAPRRVSPATLGGHSPPYGLWRAWQVESAGFIMHDPFCTNQTHGRAGEARPTVVRDR